MGDCQNRTVNGTELTSDDIVTRLRRFECRCELVEDGTKCDSCLAADEIERLRAELTQLRWDNRRLADLYEGLYHATEEARRG